MHLSARVGSGGCDSEWGLPAAPCHPLFGGCTAPQVWHLSDGQGRGTVQPHPPRGEGGGHLIRPLTNARAHSGQKSIPVQGLTHWDAAGAGSWGWCWGIIGKTELEEQPENRHHGSSILGGFSNRVSPNFAPVPETQCYKFTKWRSLQGIPLHCFIFVLINEKQPRSAG